MQARLRLKIGKKVLAENTTLKEQYEHYEVEVTDVRLLLEKPGFEEQMNKELDVVLQMTPSGTIDAKFSIVNPKNLEEQKKFIADREKENAEFRTEQQQAEADEQEKRIKTAESEGFKLFEQEQETRRKNGQTPLEYGQVGEITDPRFQEQGKKSLSQAFKGGSWADWDKFRDSRSKQTEKSTKGQSMANADSPEKKPGRASTAAQNVKSAASRVASKLKK